MKVLTPFEGLAILGIFAVVMFAVAWAKMGRDVQRDTFLVANRDVSLVSGSFSIAASWIWAPAVFICSMQAYDKGLPGIFWFTAPNILCFFLFAPLALRFRRLMPKGYTLPEFIHKRFGGHKPVHLAFLVVFFGYQFGALVINCVAGGTLLHAICGLDIRVAIVAMSTTTVAYSLLSGLKTSILTDVVQMATILAIGFVLVPWCIVESGGWSAVAGGLGGHSGQYSNILHPSVAWTMGIPMTLGLFAGPIADQMFFQRALAVRKEHVVYTFVGGGLLFGVVPIALSLLGFLAANPESGIIAGTFDHQVVGAVVVAKMLPKAALVLFCFMAFAGLTSTLDSAHCALSALGTVDVYRRYFNPRPSDTQLLSVARQTMVITAVVGTSVALLQPRLLWAFLIYGALASAGMAPTILSLFWSRIPPSGAFYAVCLSLAVGTPLSIYANIVEN
ncbi:MAG: hypothetical protein HN348_25665, partial [Proteobacteria bacterium]|nr:hypothetical protein [Pseudomonadota bacterium]